MIHSIFIRRIESSTLPFPPCTRRFTINKHCLTVLRGKGPGEKPRNGPVTHLGPPPVRSTTQLNVLILPRSYKKLHDSTLCDAQMKLNRVVVPNDGGFRRGSCGSFLAGGYCAGACGCIIRYRSRS